MDAKRPTPRHILIKMSKIIKKQLEQEQNHRNEDHMVGYQWGGRGDKMGEKV